MAAYYNENDTFAAAWLRELIKAGLIADGEVDERSITDVSANDVRGFTQCHWFAGIGGWSLALRLAGWPDYRAVWTGSCPCQPFSSAGAQAGGHDSRDLWPVWFQLVKECRPVVVFGEQVEAAIGHGWLDRLCDDLEAEDYAVGACGLPGPSVGAFDIRQRLWFVAHAGGARAGRNTGAASGAEAGVCGAGDSDGQRGGYASLAGGAVGDMADTDGGHAFNGDIQRSRKHGLRTEDRRADGRTAITKRTESRVADADGKRRTRERLLLRAEETGRNASQVPQITWSGAVDSLVNTASGRSQGSIRSRCEVEGRIPETIRKRRADALNMDIAASNGSQSGRALYGEHDGEIADGGFWTDCNWLPCSDGKARPVEPGTFPLAYGVSNRVGRLRGYGNAIKPQVAQVFIEAYMSIGEPIV